MLRPRPARWFEILCARDDATLVLEALARSGPGVEKKFISTSASWLRLPMASARCGRRACFPRRARGSSSGCSC